MIVCFRNLGIEIFAIPIMILLEMHQKCKVHVLKELHFKLGLNFMGIGLSEQFATLLLSKKVLQSTCT